MLAVRVEGRAEVTELGPCRERGATAGHAEELDRHMPRAGLKGVGEPLRIGRPGQVVAAAVGAAINRRQHTRGGVADEGFVAVVGQRHERAARGGAQGDDAAHVPRHGARLGRCGAVRIGLEHHHLFFARRIAHADQRAAIGQPLAVAEAGCERSIAMLVHRALPQREAEQLAARAQRHAVAGGVQPHRGDVVCSRHELARRLRAVRRGLHVDATRLVRGCVEQPHIGAALVDDARAVALRMACIELGVRGVALHIGAFGQA